LTRPLTYDDKGRLIGESGTMHRALTVLLRAVAIRQNVTCQFAILESRTPTREPDRIFKADHNWKPEPIMATARQISTAIFGSASVRQQSGGIETTLEILTAMGGTDYGATIEHALNRVFHAIGKAQADCASIRKMKFGLSQTLQDKIKWVAVGGNGNWKDSYWWVGKGAPVEVTETQWTEIYDHAKGQLALPIK